MRCRRAWWFALLLAGCGTPSRYLSTRIVDDPSVLPRRMMVVAVTEDVSARRGGPRIWSTLPTVTYGLSDRLELDDVLSLRWAALDDSPRPPGDDRRRDPLSLSVRGGLRGLGYSSIDGWILLPVAEVSMRRRLGTETWVGLSGSWGGQWMEHSAQWSAGYYDDLSPIRSRNSSLAFDTQVLRQLGDHWALDLGAGVHQLQACTFPSCEWAARGGQVWLGPQVRPRRWLHLALHVYVGGRHRSAAQPASAPDEPLLHVATTSSWLGTSAYAALRW